MAINTLHNLVKQRLIIKKKKKTASTHPNTLIKCGGGGGGGEGKIDCPSNKNFVQDS